MRAILLCAGFATRLRPLTDDFPKPLLRVAGRPLLDDLVEQLVASGRVDSLVVVSNARFHAHFLQWVDAAIARHAGLRITLIDDGATDEESRLGAVGDLALALRETGCDGGALVAAGDNLFRFDLEAFFLDYETSPRNLILSLRESDPVRLRRSGVPVVGEEGRVLRLEEKPAEPPAERACPPLYLLEQSALERVAEFVVSHPDADPPGHLIAWLAQNDAVFAHDMRGERYDIGDLESYRAAAAWLAARPR